MSPSVVATQSYALVLVVRRSDLVITAASGEAAMFCGRPTATLPGSRLHDLLPASVVDELLGSLSESYPGIVALPPAGAGGWSPGRYQVITHTFGEELVLEVEPRRTWPHFGDYAARLRNFTHELQAAPSKDHLLQRLCDGLVHHLGYDRAVALRFDERFAGVVTQESRPPDAPSLLNVHFRAANFPAPERYDLLMEGVYNYTSGNEPLCQPVGEYGPGARELLLRHLACRRPPATIAGLLEDSPLRTFAHLVLVVDGALWGMVYLLSAAPRYLDYQMRAFLAVIGEVAQQKIAYHRSSRSLRLQRQVSRVRDRLREDIVRADGLAGGLTAGRADLLELVPPARGAALYADGILTRFGITPAEEPLAALVAWIRKTQGAGTLWHTDHLGAAYPPAAGYGGTASGVLYLPLDQAGDQWLAWFAPEEVRPVTYATVPDERPGSGDAPGGHRRRFQPHEVTRHAYSRPWTEDAVGAARALRAFLQDVVVQRYARTKQQHARLRAAYRDLEAFSFTVSHDLRAPLRGITGYAEIIEEEYATHLGEQGTAYLATIRQQAARMDTYLTDLLALSRIEGSGIVVEELSVARLVARVLEDQVANLGGNFACTVQPELPPICGDRRHLLTLFTNLLANAIKYSSREAHPRVEVGLQGYSPDDHPVFYVADNGIGIPEHEHARVFGLFKRSANAGEFPGTGVGLALVQRIVNVHDGEVWIESPSGKGTRFLFYTGLRRAGALTDPR